MLSDSTIEMLHSSYEKRDYPDEDFLEDVARVYSVVRMLRKYLKHGKTSPRAIINNIVILYNVFGAMATYALDAESEGKCKTQLDTCLHLMGRRHCDTIDTEFFEYLESALK